MALPPGCEYHQVSPIIQNDSVKFFENASTTLVTVPRRPRSLAPTVLRCLSAFMELKLSIEYFLDVVCKASFQFRRDQVHVSQLLSLIIEFNLLVVGGNFV
jgi:hypothetical protein